MGVPFEGHKEAQNAQEKAETVCALCGLKIFAGIVGRTRLTVGKSSHRVGSDPIVAGRLLVCADPAE